MHKTGLLIQRWGWEWWQSSLEMCEKKLKLNKLKRLSKEAYVLQEDECNFQ